MSFFGITGLNFCNIKKEAAENPIQSRHNYLNLLA